MDELPHKLKQELAIAIHTKMYASVKFFKSKQKSFVVWVGTVIRPVNYQEGEYICKEGERIGEMYFMVNGSAAYVLPRFENKPFFDINQGDHFGHVDLFGMKTASDSLVTVSTKKKIDYSRKFTIMALASVELLSLAVPDLDKIRCEFPDVYDELYNDGHSQLRLHMKYKRLALKNE
jgi:CRP-like cAMP-binding protein